MENPVIIFGADAYGKEVKDLFTHNSVLIFGFLDDNKDLHNKEIGEVVVLGSTDDDGFLKLIGQKAEAFVAVRNTAERKKMVKMLNERRHIMPVNAIHQAGLLSDDLETGHGNFIGARAVIGPFVKMGSHNIIGAGAIIGTDVKMGDFIEIGAGSIINSEVEIDDEVFIGSGVTIVAGVKIGKGARIGAGSVVIENVEDKSTWFGNPAKKIG